MRTGSSPDLSGQITQVDERQNDFLPAAMYARTIITLIEKHHLLKKYAENDSVLILYGILTARMTGFLSLKKNKFKNHTFKLKNAARKLVIAEKIFGKLTQLLFHHKLLEDICDQAIMAELTPDEIKAILEISHAILKNNPSLLTDLISANLTIFSYDENEYHIRHLHKILESVLNDTINTYYERAESIQNTLSTFHGYYELVTVPDKASGSANISFKMVKKDGELTNLEEFTIALLGKLSLIKQPTASLTDRLFKNTTQHADQAPESPFLLLVKKLEKYHIQVEMSESGGYKLIYTKNNKQHVIRCFQRLRQYVSSQTYHPEHLRVRQEPQDYFNKDSLSMMSCLKEAGCLIRLLFDFIDKDKGFTEVNSDLHLALSELQIHYAAANALESCHSHVNQNQRIHHVVQLYMTIKGLLLNPIVSDQLFLFSAHSPPRQYALIFLLQSILCYEQIFDPSHPIFKFINDAIGLFHSLLNERFHMQTRLTSALNEAVLNYCAEKKGDLEAILNNFLPFLKMRSQAVSGDKILLHYDVSSDDISTAHFNDYSDATIKLYQYLNNSQTYFASAVSFIPLTGYSHPVDILTAALKKFHIIINKNEKGEFSLDFSGQQESMRQAQEAYQDNMKTFSASLQKIRSYMQIFLSGLAHPLPLTHPARRSLVSSPSPQPSGR